MLHEYHVIYSVRYYPKFPVTAVGLGTYYPWTQGHYCIWKKDPTQWRNLLNQKQCQQNPSTTLNLKASGRDQITNFWLMQHVPMAVQRRSERKNWKWNNSNARSGIINKISCDKNITNRCIANTGYVNNLMRQYYTLYQHAQYWQNSNT